MTIDVLIASKFINTVLAGSATIVSLVGTSFSSDFIPEEEDYPGIVWTMMSTNDVVGIGATRIMLDDVFLIKAIDKNEGYATVAAIYAEIDTLFKKVSWRDGDDFVIACSRVGRVKYKTFEGGASYAHLGGLYRIYSQLLS